MEGVISASALQRSVSFPQRERLQNKGVLRFLCDSVSCVFFLNCLPEKGGGKEAGEGPTVYCFYNVSDKRASLFCGRVAPLNVTVSI